MTAKQERLIKAICKWNDEKFPAGLSVKEACDWISKRYDRFVHEVSAYNYAVQESLND